MRKMAANASRGRKAHERHLACAVAAACLVACAPPFMERNWHAHPLVLFGYERFRSCEPIQLNIALAPADAERQSFASRIERVVEPTGAHHRLLKPIPVHCVASKYRVEELRRWASKGDPVAQYAMLLHEFASEAEICARAEHVERQLIIIAEHAAEAEFVTLGIAKRVPEAYEVIEQVRSICNLPAGDFSERAKAAGFFSTPLYEF